MCATAALDCSLAVVGRLHLGGSAVWVRQVETHSLPPARDWLPPPDREMVIKVLHNLSSHSVVYYLKFQIDKGFLGRDNYRGNVPLLDKEVELFRANAEGSAQIEGLPLTKPPGAPQTETEQEE